MTSRPARLRRLPASRDTLIHPAWMPRSLKDMPHAGASRLDVSVAVAGIDLQLRAELAVGASEHQVVGWTLPHAPMREETKTIGHHRSQHRRDLLHGRTVRTLCLDVKPCGAVRPIWRPDDVD